MLPTHSRCSGGSKALLAEVDWTVPWQANERDPLWARLEAAFE